MFKDKLKENRLKLNLSQDQLAQKVFVSRSAVAKWEQGRGLPEDESLDRLAQLFGMPSDELLTKEDMKKEIEADEKNLNRSKKKTLISAIVAGMAVVGLTATLLCGAFVYNPSGEEAVETYTLDSVESKNDRLIALNLQGKGRINYSQWENAKFRDENEGIIEAPADLNFRGGDTVEVSYLADKNLFGQKRVGSLGFSEITLKSHLFSRENTLFGVGFTFEKSGTPYEEAGPYQPKSDKVAYARFYETGLDEGTLAVHTEWKNIYSFHADCSWLYNDITQVVAFDPAVTGARSIWPFFNDVNNGWKQSYFSMSSGMESGFSGINSVILGSMTASFVGAMPNGTNAKSSCGYQYCRYTVTLMAKTSPTRYLIKSYDASDTLLQSTEVLPTSDLSKLNLPEGRSYSYVEEYQGTGLVSTSEKIGKDSRYYLYFANAAGFYDFLTSLCTL
jgi:DNA-binding XRE family transcriptional regulator